MGSNFIWSEGDGESREDNDCVCNQVGGLIQTVASSPASYGWVISVLLVLVYSITLLDGILIVTVGCLSVL